MTIIINVLIATGIVAALALALGVALALVNHFFFVPESELKKKARECLPGINCGACGYKGCDDYAVAVSEGKAKTNLCVPGAADVAKSLATAMGVEDEDSAKKQVAFVQCNGVCDAVHPKAVYDGIETCHAASMIYGGPSACRFGCLGYGDCTKVCPSEAICLKDGVAHIDPRRCLGCGLCTNTCPKHLIELLPSDALTVVVCSNKESGALARKACSNACIGCKKCEKTCPHGAIRVTEQLARIDYEKCTGCGECVSACPTGALKTVDFSAHGA